jgi:hypothetical protein
MPIAFKAEHFPVDGITGVEAIAFQVHLIFHHRLAGYSRISRVSHESLEQTDVREIAPDRFIARLVYCFSILDKRIDVREKNFR